jgi:hypothetical protein
LEEVHEGREVGMEIGWYVPLRPSYADGAGVPAIKKAIVALVGGFGIQANNLW